LFHQGHTWLRQVDSEVVTIGMSDFAQKLVGRVESITLPEIGSHVSQGDTAWHLNLHSESIRMLSPVDGEIIAVNEAILNSTDLINRDPYGDGWLIKVRPSRLDSNARNLLTDKVAKSWLGGIVQDLRAHMNDGLVPVYQDGGELIQGIARAMEGQKWASLVKTYFLSE
jgi:glycine cleavage system H protein